MIPKTIHYCWFGKKPLPRSALKCIESWKKYLPNYKIIEWNESNFDVSVCNYCAQAYQRGKYAFVSDYARVWILYHNGGIYFDTDVELIAPMDDILAKGPWMGLEIQPNDNSQSIAVNTGLGFAAEKNDYLLMEILMRYSSLSFLPESGGINTDYAIVRLVTDALLAHGMQRTSFPQKVEGFTIYPASVFNPMNSVTGKISLTPETKAIHHYDNSWGDRPAFISKISRLVHRFFANWQ